MVSPFRACAALTLFLFGAASGMAQDRPAGARRPSVGDAAPDFTLTSLTGSSVTLSRELTRGPLVLVVLRGWPGYDCPFCTKQFADYVDHAAQLSDAGLRVVFVYPGPADGLAEHARAFTAARPIPSNFTIVLDPDYTFTNRYGLRWDAPKETAYPATFLLERSGRIRFAKVSGGHGDRVTVAEVLAAFR
jgi:peroxiredoxin Q/BCP